MILSNRVGEDQYAKISLIAREIYNLVQGRDENFSVDC